MIIGFPRPIQLKRLLRDIEQAPEWVRVKAFGSETGTPNMLQICHDLRPEQYRGVPYLAPVIETLKQVSRYTNAELTAAIIKSFFALFFTEETAGQSIEDVLPGTGVAAEDAKAPTVDPSEYSLSAGTMNALPKGVDVKTVDASNSMSTFEIFTKALEKQIGAAIGQPYEVLMKTFNSSYSASRAALLQAWDEYKTLDFTLIRGLDSLFVRDSDNRTLISGFFDLFGSLELDSLTM